MAQTLWEAGVLTDVWIPVGRSDEGNPRYRRANFDILAWSQVVNTTPDTYVLPLGQDRYPGAEIVLKDTAQVGQEFGFYEMDSIVLEPSSGDGQSDTIQALHTFGYV